VEEPLMSISTMLRYGPRAVSIAAATLIFGLPALAGTVFSWRTEDGGYAFTDDAKAIPPRYRDQVETRQTEGLGGYHRLTTPDAGATATYSQRLADRLDHLRSLNRDLNAAYAPQPVETGVDSLAVQAGTLNVEVPLDGADDGPVVIEKVRFRHKGEMATRHNLVVRKGDGVLAIVKGNPLVSEINQAPDISEMVD
jgi:hypothetical protein